MNNLAQTESSQTIRSLDEMRALHAELKSQVDELEKARSWAEALLAQYSDLYDFSCVSYFTLDRAATVREANQSAATLLGAVRAGLPGRSFNDFVPRQSTLAFVRYLARVFSSASNAKTEIDLVNETGDVLVVAVEGKMANNGKECRLALTDITEQKRTEEDLRFLTMFDPLTGLHNRGFFQEEMTRLESGREFPISVMMADVDDLKVTNDRAGHAAGDEMLRRVGRMLKSAFRAADIVARIGGDEFAVLLPNSDQDAAAEAAQRVERALSADNARHKRSPISLSIGFSTANTKASLSELLQVADRRMYEVKSLVKAKPQSD
jgi:diguanylate cyclase (GGDEF)-like protein/PAS domain S-box-containing protein